MLQFLVPWHQMVPVPSFISTINYITVTINFQYVVVLVLSVKARFSLVANSQPSCTGNTSLIVQQNIGCHLTYTLILDKRNLYPNSTSASSLQRLDSNLFQPYGHLLKDKIKRSYQFAFWRIWVFFSLTIHSVQVFYQFSILSPIRPLPDYIFSICIF
jgi:hypothetical protein